jgi:hypothetical protein
MALHPTPLRSPCHTHKVCTIASEIGLLAGHAACLQLVSWRACFAVAPKTTLVIGVVGCRCPVGCTSYIVGRSSLAYSRFKESPTKKMYSEPPFHGFLTLDCPSPSLLRGKTERLTNECHDISHGTEHGPFSDYFRATCFERRSIRQQTNLCALLFKHEALYWR